MLITLQIENFAIVSKLTLEFSHGMTAFTGETGAGKSIMIDALMLALGGRADTSVIRTGAEKCDISAGFSFDPHTAPAHWLLEHDVPAEEGEVFLRRIVSAEGRSKSSINGIPFPLHKIKELSEMLVDIHGQHQHQRLLTHTTHREQLDQYAGHAALLQEVHDLFCSCQKLKEQQRLLLETTPEQAALLDEHIEELDALCLQHDELTLLYREHHRLHHAHEHLEKTQAILNLLNADDTPNVKQWLHTITQCLSSLPQDDLHVQQSTEMILNAQIQCDEALDEIDLFASRLNQDPEHLARVEERMSAIHHLARKHHVDPHQLHAHHVTLKQERQRLQDLEHKKTTLTKQLLQQREAYLRQAHTLRQSRTHHAKKLAAEITAVLQRLGMPHGQMFIELTEQTTLHAHGLDKVEYQVCTNPGMLPDTLIKIASGGELSRISLAIQLITAQRGATPTLLFDEVDVGIGGATAARVGQLLRHLGERLQLFCVTHQPQVAACAHHHYRVEKDSDDTQTFSRIVSLTPDNRVDEIARMLGGLTITPQTRSHAKELLDQAETPLTLTEV